METTAIVRWDSNRGGRRGRQDVALPATESVRKIGCVFKGVIFARGAGPANIHHFRLRAFSHPYVQGGSRAHSDNRRWAVNVVGRPVAALSLVVSSPHPERTISLEGEIVII